MDQVTAIPLKPVDKQRVFRQIVDQLAHLIETGVIPEGEQLPPERDLAWQLGVSRPSVREALSAMEMLGLVETKPGHGTFVCAQDSAVAVELSRAELDKEESPFALLAARRILEPGTAALAARVRSEEALLRIKRAIETGEANLDDVDARLEADRGFHRAVAESTDNPVVEAMMQFIWGLMGQKLWRALDRVAEALPGRLEQGWREHRAVFEAIKAQDGQIAYRAMIEHLDAVEVVMRGGEPGEGSNCSAQGRQESSERA